MSQPQPELLFVHPPCETFAQVKRQRPLVTCCECLMQHDCNECPQCQQPTRHFAVLKGVAK